MNKINIKNNYIQNPTIVKINEKVLLNNKKNIRYDREKLIILHPKTKKENIIYLEECNGFYAEIIEKEKDVYYLYVFYNTGEIKFHKLKE